MIQFNRREFLQSHCIPVSKLWILYVSKGFAPHMTSNWSVPFKIYDLTRWQNLYLPEHKYIISSISECLKWIFLFTYRPHFNFVFSPFSCFFCKSKARKLLFCHMRTKKVLFSKALQEICKNQYLVVLLSPFVSNTIIAWASISVQ